MLTRLGFALQVDLTLGLEEDGDAALDAAVEAGSALLQIFHQWDEKAWRSAQHKDNSMRGYEYLDRDDFF